MNTITTKPKKATKIITSILIILFFLIILGAGTIYHIYAISEVRKTLEIPVSGAIQNEIVYLDVDSVIVYDNFEAASSSGQSTGKSLLDILPELIKAGKLYLYKDTTIGLYLDKSIQTSIYGASTEVKISIYQIGNYFLRVTS